MVAEAANTYVSVLRGTTTNAFGDVIDSNAVYLRGVPAILVETGRQVQDPSSPTPRTIRAINCHLPDGLGLKNTDRILDERSGETYIVMEVTRPPDMFGPPSGLTLQLKKVTAAGP